MHLLHQFIQCYIYFNANDICEHLQFVENYRKIKIKFKTDKSNSLLRNLL